MTFPKKTPDEVKLLTFDFSPEAAEGTTLSNPVFNIEMKTDVGDPADIALGTPAFADALDADANVIVGHEGHWVQVLCGDGVDGAKYWIQCEVEASNGEVHRIDKILPIKEAGALVP